MKRNKVLVSAIAILLSAFSVVTSVLAAVGFTKDACGALGEVYVAGNPDLYPIEYYDEKSETYVGLLPELLKDISAQCGVDFTYIRSGVVDRRAQLAKNGQVELISGVVASRDLSDDLTASEIVCTATIDGERVGICFAFTDIASAPLVELINAYIASMDADTLVDRVVTVTMKYGKAPVPLWVKLAVAISILLLFAVTTVAALVIHRSNQEKQAYKMTDPLTGIGNKEYFYYYFKTIINKTNCSLYYIFYIGFDMLAFTMGNDDRESDALNRYIAQTLSDNVPDTGFFARITDSTYAVSLQCVSRSYAQEEVSRLLTVLNAYFEKFGKLHVVDIRAGVYRLNASDASCAAALHAAEQGYRCAAENHLPYCFIQDQDVVSTQEDEELQSGIRGAMKAHEFKPYLQFVIATRDGSVYSAEMLSRWMHPQKGLIMPSKYIQAMESNEAIIDFDFYMIEECCGVLDEILASDGAKILLFCNISRITFSQRDFIERIQQILQKHGDICQYLCLEITESCMFRNGEVAEHNCVQCKELGLKIVLDDVGSGYSSFADLTKYPVDIIKFDRSILLGAEKETGRKLLAELNSMFHSIDIRTLCEGVETEEQFQMVCDLGVDYIQGFYVQRPLPVDEATTILLTKASTPVSPDKG